MSIANDYSWMRAVLAALFERCSAEDALAAIRDQRQREALTAALSECEGPGRAIPPDDVGDNLLLALLSLRAKFSRDEAMAKVELNISMRHGRGGMRQ